MGKLIADRDSSDKVLSNKIDEALLPYREEYNTIIGEWMCEDGTFGITYPAFLVETYHYVRHSCLLMRESLERIDHTRSVLRRFWEKHIEEEIGHEAWALDDLFRLGYSRSDVTNSEPLPETIALIGTQLFMIQCVEPVSLLGYAYMMETRPPNSKFLKAVQEAYSIPSDAMTFLLKHGEADIAHAEELRNVVNSVVNEEEEQATINSAILGLSHINRMLLRVKKGRFISTHPLLVAVDSQSLMPA